MKIFAIAALGLLIGGPAIADPFTTGTMAGRVIERVADSDDRFHRRSDRHSDRRSYRRSDRHSDHRSDRRHARGYRHHRDQRHHERRYFDHGHRDSRARHRRGHHRHGFRQRYGRHYGYLNPYGYGYYGALYGNGYIGFTYYDRHDHEIIIRVPIN